MMKLKTKKDAAKNAFCRGAGRSSLLRSIGALLLAACLLAAIPMGAVMAEGEPVSSGTTSEPVTGEGSSFGGDYLIMTIDGDGLTNIPKDRSDLYNFLTDMTITDSEGKSISPEDGTLYVGEQYKIHLQFGEGGSDGQGLQFSDESDTLTYQIPKAFKVDPVKDLELTVNIGGKDVVIGHYTIDDMGMLTLTLTDEGKERIKSAVDLKFSFDMNAEAVPMTGSEGGSVDFGGTGKNFHFSIVDQPLVDVEKDGAYTELNEDGGKLSYTVTTKVKHGEVKDVVLKDELTPPQNDAFVLESAPENVTVTFRQTNADGTITVTELTSDNYDLVEVEDPDNLGKKTFQVKLKDPYATMREGDEVSVTYDYAVSYNKTSSTQKLWAEVANEATVTGNMEIKDPADPESQPTEKEFTEKDKNSVEMRVTPPGKGIVSKDQEYSELTNTLHYTLYTTVPAGTWEPMYIFDDMYVQYQGERWYFQEFLPEGEGRVKNLEVRTADLPDDWFDGKEGATDAEKLQSLQDLINQAKMNDPLKGWKLDDAHFGWNWSENLPGYDSEDMDEYVARLGGRELNIVFGYDGWTEWGTWGHWNYNKDRLIVTEYDLDMSTTLGDKITLVKGGDYSKNPVTIELSPEEILRAGITNNVYLRYGPYYPGYAVFFNNADEINKSGEVRKNGKDVYIDYTVTMNTTDESVRRYFYEVVKDWSDKSIKSNPDGTDNWDYNTNGNVQAVFYDVLPDGWEYVEDSLYLTVKYTYDTEIRLESDRIKELGLGPTDKNGDIRAPLIYFRRLNAEGIQDLEFMNLFGDLNKCDIIEIAFHYTLKATEKWLAEHTGDDDGVAVNNHAEILDKNKPEGRWDAKNTEYYFPNKLTKAAEQVDEGGNLLRFTLDVNPDGEWFKQQGMENPQSYLIVTDKSANLQIQENTIKVYDANGNALEGVGQKTLDDLKAGNWDEGAWGTLPPDPGEEGQFKLVVPNGKHLTVTYDALITVDGNTVQVSNEAGIEGVERSNSSYEGSLKVNDIESSGSASQYSLTIYKQDEKTRSMLAGAEFDFYIVRSAESTLSETKNFTINGENYSCHSGNKDGEKWNFVINEDGSYTIDENASWSLYPGNYYVLEETKAPEGYMKLKEPILFYFGTKNNMDEVGHPGAALVVPGGGLTVCDTPIQALRVVKEGSVGSESNPLAGAVFALYPAKAAGDGTFAENGQALYTGTSGKDGLVQWDGSGTDLLLTPGEYYILRETAAPDGYDQLAGDVVLRVTEDGKLAVVGELPESVTGPAAPDNELVFQITVDDPSSYVLPESGGMGTARLYALGTALILTAALGLVCDVRRRRARS